MHKLYVGFFWIVLVSSLSIKAQNLSPFDLTIVGPVMYGESLGRLSISLTRILKDDLRINHIYTPGSPYNYDEIPQDIAAILQNPDKTPGNVALLFDVLWLMYRNPSQYVPKNSLIKIAYSMLEGTEIPPEWVDILNKNFDLVAVPDEYYEHVYKNCGVKIPIFVLPHGADLEDFLAKPVRKKAQKPFVFGSSAVFMPRKNHRLLVEAFYKEFGDDPNVHLKIHGRSTWEFECDFKAIKEVIQDIPISECRLPEMASDQALLKGHYHITPNIELIRDPFTHKEYVQFLDSLDCYVLLSKGEGFSVTPREALALGKPCIISNNTAHKTIGKTGYVYPVPSQITEPARYPGFSKLYYGQQFLCSVEDTRMALRTVYNNYELYRTKAEKGRIWVKKYLWKNLKAKFLNMIKPKQVLWGDENKVTDDFIMTNSAKLYRKYTKLMKD